MASHLTLTLDTAPPGNPVLLINRGAVATADRDALVTLTTPDYESGAHDVVSMRLWGDVDLTHNLSIQQFEDESDWITYTTEMVVRLSSATGRKRLHARLLDDVGNQSLVASTYIEYDPALPLVSIVTPLTQGRISVNPLYDESTFTWSSNVPFVEYRVRVVPSLASGPTAGLPLGSTNGSVAVSGSGSFSADTPIATTIKGADLVAAAPGEGPKVIKVFVRDSAGRWSA